jgi:hypothetical protein
VEDFRISMWMWKDFPQAFTFAELSPERLAILSVSWFSTNQE